MTSTRQTDYSQMSRGRNRLTIVVLIVATLAVYSSVWRFGFVRFDDEEYIYENAHVVSGLSLRALVWAFTTGYAANYHPLTWLSLQLDVSLFGLSPPFFHIENVVLHLVNTLLLFALLKKITARHWPSAFVAAVFALHPAHVESVAWVSERKDVLSTFFLLMAMLCYARYVVRHSRRVFCLMMILYALSLLAKQMGVTLPMILLLLDNWPLSRNLVNWKIRLLEKIPLLLLAITGSIATFIAQRAGGAVVTVAAVPVNLRLQSVCVSYARYIATTFWPVNLCAFYPYQPHLPFTLILGSAALMLLVSAICYRIRHRHPYLMTGWFWFVIMLLPVIGIVQIGSTSIADRYLYMPMVGLTIMLAWAVTQWLDRRSSIVLNRTVFLSAFSILIILGMMAHRQAGYWQTTRTLFTHALPIINQDADAHMQLARLDLDDNDPAAARNEYELAAKLAPSDFAPEYDLGNLLMNDPPQAIVHYQRALALKPDSAQVLNNLGIAWVRSGRPDLAVQAFQAAIAADPSFADPRVNLKNLQPAPPGTVR